MSRKRIRTVSMPESMPTFSEKEQVLRFAAEEYRHAVRHLRKSRGRRVRNEREILEDLQTISGIEAIMRLIDPKLSAYISSVYLREESSDDKNARLLAEAADQFYICYIRMRF